MSEFVLQGSGFNVHVCRHGWCPGTEQAHRKHGECPLYGERQGHRVVAKWWTPRPFPDWRAIPGFDVSMVLPLEEP